MSIDNQIRLVLVAALGMLALMWLAMDQDSYAH